MSFINSSGIFFFLVWCFLQQQGLNACGRDVSGINAISLSFTKECCCTVKKFLCLMMKSQVNVSCFHNTRRLGVTFNVHEDIPGEVGDPACPAPCVGQCCGRGESLLVFPAVGWPLACIDWYERRPHHLHTHTH